MATEVLRPTPAVARLLATVDQAIDDDVARLSARAGAREQLACRRSCAACCTFAVGTTDVEAARVADFVEAMPRALRQDTLERLSAWEREWRLFERRAGETTAIVAATGRDDALIARDVRWNAKRKACPFLDLSTHDCRVYPVRPVACRTHHACYVPPDAPPRDDGRHTQQPGDGCFTSDDDAARGLPPGVWQLDAGLMERWGATLLTALDAAGVRWLPASLPIGVIESGRRRHGWRPPPPRRPVPVLRSTWPRGGRR